MSCPRILITGCNGQVGFELQRALAPLGQIHALDRQALNLADRESLRRQIRDLQPNIIVNAAAYTAVDRAETEPELALAINGLAPGVLGEVAREIGAVVVHYSTDYVFDGLASVPYGETDTPNPLGVYGSTKLAGERALADSGCRYLTFRTSWVFGAHGANFLKTMLRLAAERESLGIVADQFGAPTSAALIADVTVQVLGQYLRHPSPQDFPWGLYHLTATGSTCWHDYAARVIATARAKGVSLHLPENGLQAISTRDYPTPARRPANSRLDTQLLQNTFGLCLPAWEQGVDHVLQQLL